jgi:ABC-2 type transport system permease protein
MAPRRLKALIRKEFLQVLRDPSSIAIAFLMPVVLLVLHGYGVSLDAEHVPIAMVVEAPSSEAMEFAGAFQGSKYFNPRVTTTMEKAVQALRSQKVKGIVRIRPRFAGKVAGGDGASVQVIVNGVDANTARLIQGYAEGAWASWLRHRARAQGTVFSEPVQIQHRIWFNSEVKSRNFLVPGLIAVIMTLIGALLTALVMAREWERGTMETLMATPVGMPEILLGKLIPYFALGTGGMGLSVGMAVWLFNVPLRGSPWVLFGAASLFLLVALGMGLFISTVAKNQFVAGQIAILATFLPAFILSGFVFDIDSMPVIVRAITHIIAARYFVTILQTVFLAGNVWPVILPNALALLVMAAIFLVLTRLRSRKRLD